jgi:glycosyltransferase involved in cell wall biosynthesis
VSFAPSEHPEKTEFSPALAVVISTHAPNEGRLVRTLDGLRSQTLQRDRWELILVDNASPDPSAFDRFDVRWHPAGQLVREGRLGLTFGRVAGVRASRAPLLVLVDDDNVLARDYLERVHELFERHPRVGALGGRSIPEWEVPPPDWIGEFSGCLALRDGEVEQISDRKSDSGYPRCAPSGAGMAIRREALEPWLDTIAKAGDAVTTGRRGKQLTSGEDNDIVLHALAAGWSVGYFPQLCLTHLIPVGRLTRDYLARLNHGIAKSWVEVLDRHGIRPWPPIPAWSVPLRKLRARVRFRAWRDAPSYIRWQGACGKLDGQALLEAERDSEREQAPDAGTYRARAAQAVRPGRLLYRLYYAPRGFLNRCRREGAANLFLSWQGRGQMERAAATLPPVESAEPPAADVYFLSGRKFWYQTCFCAWTLLRHSDLPLRPVVLDDGTLDQEMRTALRRVLPQIRFELLPTIEERLDRALPATRYPTLRRHRLVYPHLRKLTDVHAGLIGWRLMLDSDMLFFRRPTFLLDWLRHPQCPVHMLDVAPCYGYSSALLGAIAGAALAERLNVGIIGLRSETIDWDRLESWCRMLLERHGSHYLLEQGLTAMLLAERACMAAPERDYVVLPAADEVRRPRAVLHHYVAESKALYFRHGWRSVLAAPASAREAVAV